MKIKSMYLLFSRRSSLLLLAPRHLEILTALSAPLILISMWVFGEVILRVQQYVAFGVNQAVETEVNRQIWEEST